MMVNCSYPKAALPIDIECYRTVMTKAFEYLMTDKTASKEQANKLKVELLRKASDGACLFGAEPPHEEEGVSKEEEPAEEEDVERALELAEDEDSFNVHDWFNFGNLVVSSPLTLCTMSGAATETRGSCAERSAAIGHRSESKTLTGKSVETDRSRDTVAEQTKARKTKQKHI